MKLQRILCSNTVRLPSAALFAILDIISVIYTGILAWNLTNVKWPLGPWQWLTVWNLTFHCIYYCAVTYAILTKNAPLKIQLFRLVPIVTAHTILVTIAFYGITLLDPSAIPLGNFPWYINHYEHGILTLALFYECYIASKKHNFLSSSLYREHLDKFTLLKITTGVALFAVIIQLSTRFIFQGAWPYPFIARLEDSAFAYKLILFYLFLFWFFQVTVYCCYWYIFGSKKPQTSLPLVDSLAPPEPVTEDQKNN